MSKEDDYIFTQLFNKCEFTVKLVRVAAPIFGQHMQELMKNKSEETVDDYGTETEQQLKRTMSYATQLSICFDDLEQVMIHLTVDRDEIKNLYGAKLHAEDYFKYHYDNFVIRLATIHDLCGKIGISLYGLPISDKKANGWTFAFSPVVKGKLPEERITAVADFLEEFLKQRHLKVHQAKSEDNWFERIVFWDRLADLIGDETLNTPALEELNAKKVGETIDRIRAVIDQAAELSIEFMSSLMPQLEALISQNTESTAGSTNGNAAQA